MTLTRWDCLTRLVRLLSLLCRRPHPLNRRLSFPSRVSFATCRPRGLRPSPTIIIPPDGRVPCVLQRDVAPVVREREGEVVPRGAPPLSRRALPHRGHAGRSAGRPPSAGEAGTAEAAPHYPRPGRAACTGIGRRQVCGVLGIDAEGPEERVRRGASPAPPVQPSR